MNRGRGVAGLRRRSARGVSFVEAMVLVAFAVGAVLAGAKVLGAQADETSDSLGEHIKAMTETQSRTSATGSGANSGDTYAATNATCDSTHSCEAAPAVPVAAAAVVAPPSQPESRGFWGNVGSFGTGFFVDGVWGTVVGVGTMIAHPIDTAVGIGSAVAHPIDTVTGAYDGLTKAWAEDPARVLGGGLFKVVTIVGPGAIAKVGTVAKVGEVAAEASTAGRVAKVATTAKAGEQTASTVAKAGELCEGGVCTKLGNCFAAGTPVLTEEGERSIEDLAVGDLVLARDPDTGETRTRHVTHLFVTPDQELVDLGIEANGTTDHVQVTLEHPFFTQDLGFVSVRSLFLGEHLQTALGDATVVSLTSLPERATVFNFEVEEAHTYFVGHVSAWVHNQCTKPPVYEASPKHGPKDVGNIARAPTNGPAALENSVQIKGTSTRRIGVDPAPGEIVMLPETGNGVFHGYVVKWGDLTAEQQNALVKAGMVTRKGKIIVPPP